MKRIVRVTRRAARQMAAASSWWHENRPLAPTMFDNELRQAIAALAELAEIYAKIDDDEFPDVGQVLLERSRYHLYFRVADADAVDVIACWHTSRGAKPPIK